MSEKANRKKRSYDRKQLLSDFISKSSQRYNNKFDYSNIIEYESCKKRVPIACPSHGVFYQTPDFHLQGKGCPLCSRERTGKSQRLGTDTFIERAKKVHGDKFIYDKTVYLTQKNKLLITCKIHGDFSQSPNNHLYGKGCPRCRYDANQKKHQMGLGNFMAFANNRFNNKFDYSGVVYVNCDLPVSIVCPDHGQFSQTPYTHLRAVAGCPKCSAGRSSHEKEIGEFLTKHGIPFDENNRTVLNGKEIDFLINNKIGIEVNGIYWHSELSGKNKDYHLDKTVRCNKLGIRLIQIFENEFIDKKRLVFSRLKSIFGLNRYSLYARKCVVKEIDGGLKNKFLNKYHLQGQDYTAQVNLGLFYKNRLVSVMTFSRPRVALNSRDEDNRRFELSRFCSLSSFNVKGAAGKLLSFFEKKYQPKSIVSYADRRWSDGNLYNVLNFKHTHNSNPSYYYFKNSTYKLQHRFSFRKSVLEKKLPNFDNNLSEWENMQNNGYNRIWDCGCMVFEKICQ